MSENASQPSQQLMADVVLEGGGVKGIALVGALAVLAENSYVFGRVAGTSAGAIVGALLAAGMPVEEMRAVMEQTDYSKFQDKGPEDRIPLVGKVWSLVSQSGIYEGDYARDYVAELLEGQGVRVFGDAPILLDPDEDSDRPDERRFRLVVMASDVTLRRLVRLPWDYDPRYNMVPDEQMVADAVRASMSIPFFFEPVRLKYRDDEGRKTESVLVDGGMLSNFPVDVFDRRDGRAPRWPTLGIKLSSRADNRTMAKPIDGPLGLTGAMIATMTSFHDGMYIDREDVRARTIFVDTMGVKATDFDIDEQTQQELYDNGREAATKFLQTWNYEEYVEQYRAPPPAP